MKPGHGEVLLAEGDVEVPEQERELIEAFRAQLDAGMWAAVPTAPRGGRREAELVRSFEEVPRDAERVIFFPRAAGGALAGRAVLLALGACAIVVLALLWEVSRRRRSAPGARAGRPRRRRVDRSRPTTRAASAGPSSARGRCCARASTTRSGRCTATSASCASGAAARAVPATATASTAAARPTPT